MARLLVISRSMALALRLADAHQVVEASVDELPDLVPGPEVDVVVLDVGEPSVAIRTLDRIRASGSSTPLLIVSGYQPAWAGLVAVHIPGVLVVPLPITRTALMEGIAQLAAIGGSASGTSAMGTSAGGTAPLPDDDPFPVGVGPRVSPVPPAPPAPSAAGTPPAPPGGDDLAIYDLDFGDVGTDRNEDGEAEVFRPFIANVAAPSATPGTSTGTGTGWADPDFTWWDKPPQPQEAEAGLQAADAAEVDAAEVDAAEVDPAEVDPAEVDPAEVDPAPADPAPADPAPADPAPADPLEVIGPTADEPPARRLRRGWPPSQPPTTPPARNRPPEVPPVAGAPEDPARTLPGIRIPGTALIDEKDQPIASTPEQPTATAQDRPIAPAQDSPDEVMARRRALLGRTADSDGLSVFRRRLGGRRYSSSLGPGGTSPELVALGLHGSTLGDETSDVWTQVPAPLLPMVAPPPDSRPEHDTANDDTADAGIANAGTADAGTADDTGTADSPEPTTAPEVRSPAGPTPAERQIVQNLVRRLIERVDDVRALAALPQALAEELVARLEADAAAVLLPNERDWQVAGAVGLSPAELTAQLPASHWLIGRLARRPDVLTVDGEDLRRRLTGAPLMAWRHVAAAGVPGVDAVLLIARGPHARAIAPADQARLATVAGQTAQSLETAVDVRRLLRLLAAHPDHATVHVTGVEAAGPPRART